MIDLLTLTKLKDELAAKHNTDGAGLLRRVPFPQLESRVYLCHGKKRSQRISGDCQRSVLIAIDEAYSGGKTCLTLFELAKIAGMHSGTMTVAVAALVDAGYVWQDGPKKAPVRAPRWDVIACWLDEQTGEAGIPLTYDTALDAAAAARDGLLAKYQLASTRPIVANLCLRTITDSDKPVGAETQREVLRVLSSFEPLACGLTLPQIAERVGNTNGLTINSRTMRRAMRCLVAAGYVWQSEMQRYAERFIRWDCLGKLIPARSSWRSDEPNSKTLLERVQIAKKRVVALHGPTDKLLAKLDLPPASSGSVIVSPEIQRRVLTVLAAYDRGCRLTNDECAAGAEVSPRTINHVMAAMIDLGLVIEHALGNARLRFVCWDKVFDLTPAPTPVPAETHEKADGQIVVSSWLPVESDESKKSTLRAVFEKHIHPAMLKRKRAVSTIGEVTRAIDAWELHWPPELHAVQRVRPRHLEQWQDALLARQLANSTANNYLRSIQRVLIAAQRHGLIRRRPTLSKLPTRAAPRHYMRFADVEALWPAFESLGWPNVSDMETAMWWRCAIVLYWTYGFRTQELISFSEDRPALEWCAFSRETETPNPEGTAECQWGWLTYTPRKQQWAKPTPLYLPLTKQARTAIDILAQANPSKRGSLFPCPRSSRDFYSAWKRAQKAAGIEKKSGGHFQVKSLRRSAATHLERHHRGLGAALVGWADREVSEVMAKHYCVTEMMLVERLADYETPACFDTLATATTAD